MKVQKDATQDDGLIVAAITVALIALLALGMSMA